MASVPSLHLFDEHNDSWKGRTHKESAPSVTQRVGMEPLLAADLVKLQGQNLGRTARDHF